MLHQNIYIPILNFATAHATSIHCSIGDLTFPIFSAKTSPSPHIHQDAGEGSFLIHICTSAAEITVKSRQPALFPVIL